MGEQKLLDSAVLIAALRDTDSHYEEAREIFMSGSKSHFAISALTLSEVLIRPNSLGSIHATRTEQMIRNLVGTIHPIDSEIASASAKIRASHKTKLPDAIIIATAIVSGNSLVTFDRKMMGIYERIK